MKQIWPWALLSVTASVVSCAGGTETGNPASTLKDFSSSACKSRELDAGQQGLVLASDAEGLQCVEWERGTAGQLSLRLSNFPEPCGEKYLGTAAVTRAGVLELAVHKDTCAVYKCGWCVFDFELELALSPLASEQPLEVHVGEAACETAPTTFTDELTLPLGERASGVVCRSLERSPLEWYARERGSCGQRNMPCGSCGASTDVTSCAAGLSCTQLQTGDSRCLAACSADADCAGGLTTCQDGLCRASASW